MKIAFLFHKKWEDEAAKKTGRLIQEDNTVAYNMEDKRDP